MDLQASVIEIAAACLTCTGTINGSVKPFFPFAPPPPPPGRWPCMFGWVLSSSLFLLSCVCVLPWEGVLRGREG